MCYSEFSSESYTYIVKEILKQVQDDSDSKFYTMLFKLREGLCWNRLSIRWHQVHC